MPPQTKKQTNKGKQHVRNRRDSSTSTTPEMTDSVFQLFGNLQITELPKLDKNTKVQQKNNAKPKGLENLGNTCYMNSVLQVLFHTPMLYESLNRQNDENSIWPVYSQEFLRSIFKKSLVAFENGETLVDDLKMNQLTQIVEHASIQLTPKLEDEWLQMKLLPPSLLTSLFGQLMFNLNSKFSSVVRPTNFLKEMNRVLVRFKGTQQQDSHEFLRCLLDAIKLEETKRHRNSILRKFEIDVRRKVVDAKIVNQLRKFRFNSDYTLVDTFFKGYCVSSLKCEECEHASQIFEPFFDLSLPITEEKQHMIVRKSKKTREKQPCVSPNVKKTNSLVTEDTTKLSKRARKELRSAKKSARRQKRAEAKKLNNESKKKISDIKDFEKSLKNEEQDNKNDSLENSLYKEKESDGEASDDEASGKDFGEEEKTDDFSEEKNVLIEIDKKGGLQRTNTISTDSGLNHTNLVTSDVDSKGKTDTVNRLPIHLEDNGDIVEKREKSDKESDTGFEERENQSCADLEADSESEESSDEGTNSSKIMQSSSSERCWMNEDNIFDNRGEHENDKRVRTDSTNGNAEERAKARWVLSTISERQETTGRMSILSGLSQFTSPELLVGSNRINCENCTARSKAKTGTDKKVYTNASKRMLIALPPPILTLHLKRFEINSYKMTLSKVNRHITFPLAFDLAPYVSNLYKVISSGLSNYPNTSKENQVSDSIVYSLYGVIEHTGSLRSGHYKAYVRMRKNGDTDLKKFLQMSPYVPEMRDVLEMLKSSYTEFCEAQTTANETEEFNLKKLNRKIEEMKDEQWFHISDSSVNAIKLETLMHAQAYLLFYERIH